MEILDSVACADTFPNQLGSGASLGPVYRSNGGYFAVTNNDVYVQLFYGELGDLHFTLPFHVAPGNGVLVPGTVGVMFRNYTTGLTATVSAGLAEPTEPTVQLTAAGVSTPGTAGGGLQLIKSQHLSGAQPTIDFTSIPNTFAGLLLIYYLRSDGAFTGVDGWVQFNGDTGANYNSAGFLVTNVPGLAVWNSVAGGALIFAGSGLIAAAASPAANFTGGQLWIPNYATASNRKMVNAQGWMESADAAANLFPWQGGGTWKSAAVINRLTLLQNVAANYVADSWAALYGLAAV